jgi:hypothetical protein
MKNIYKSLLAILSVAVLFTSCDTDLLDIEQQGVTGVNTYETADDAQVLQYIAAVYAFVHGDAYQAVFAGGPACYLAVNSDMARMSGESARYFLYNETSESVTYSYVWSYYYRQAYWCSMIIENLPGNNVASAGVKNQVIAEARAIRAIAMMNLVQLYGNPPLADHIMDGNEGNTPAAESWAFIESELEAAAEELPTKSGLNGQSSIGGRLTKEAAYAYLGKAQLWQGKYGDAANTLYNKVISTDKYALNDDFDLINSSASDFSAENIWEFDFADDPAISTSQEGCFDLAVYQPSITFWYVKYASLLMTFGQSAYPTAEFAQFLNTHDGNSARSTGTLLDVKTASMMGMVTFPILECEGYIKAKGMCLTDDVTGAFPYLYSKRNIVYMRYAEVLLNYAEAVAMGGSSGAMSGLEALNIVRRRAGLADAPALDMNNAGYGVKAERRVELFGEGQRFIDLVRWGDAAATLAECGKYSSQLSAVNEDGTYEILKAATGGNGFKAGKNELFPIPSSDLNSNPNLVQNPGW